MLAVALVAAGAAKNQPSTIYVDRAGGYAIAIPKTWQLIPRSQSDVKALIAKLEKKSSTVPLADFYSTILASQATGAMNMVSIAIMSRTTFTRNAATQRKMDCHA